MKKKRFAGPVDWQDLRRRINLHVVAARQPVAQGLAQSRLAHRARITRQTGQAGRQRIFNQLGRRVPRLTDPETDGLVGDIGRDVGVQLAQPLKRIGLKAGKQGIHVRIIQPRRKVLMRWVWLPTTPE